jgi:hypothetical protein
VVGIYARSALPQTQARQSKPTHSFLLFLLSNLSRVEPPPSPPHTRRLCPLSDGRTGCPARGRSPDASSIRGRNGGNNSGLVEAGGGRRRVAAGQRRGATQRWSGGGRRRGAAPRWSGGGRRKGEAPLQVGWLQYRISSPPSGSAPLPASPSQRRHPGNQRSGWTSLAGSGGAGVPQEGEAAGQGVAAPALDLLSYSEKTELIFLQENTFYDFCQLCVLYTFRY